jgi:hypothetical protein
MTNKITTINLYRWRWKAVWVMLLASLFVVPIGYDISHGNCSFFNWFAPCFFGLSYPIGIYILIDPRVHLSISKDEIESITAGKVKWEEIADSSGGTGRSSMIYLYVLCTPEKEDKPQAYGEEEEPYATMLCIGTNEFNADHKELYLLVQRLIKADSTVREEILNTYPRRKLRPRIKLWKHRKNDTA